jgi:hypothetical protein
MRLTALNNATTLVQTSDTTLLFDPWIISDLYNGTWSPYPVPPDPTSLLNQVDIVYISHLHQDHWDIETIRLLDPSVRIILPTAPFTHVIESELVRNGYQNIEYMPLATWCSITSEMRIYIIPPLNRMGQELELYSEYNQDSIMTIDTGLVIQESPSKKCHVILGDNTPYDFDLAIANLGDLDVGSLWFAYNGFAQDYPLCFDQFTVEDKLKISNQMCLRREEVNIRLIQHLKPTLLVPHSSEFSLNGTRAEEFWNIHSDTFFNRDLYAKRIQALTGIPAIGLYAEDQLQYSNSSFQTTIHSTPSSRRAVSKGSKVHIPKSSLSGDLLDLLETSLSGMFQRCQRHSVDTSAFDEWTLWIHLGDECTFEIDFSDNRVSLISTKPTPTNLLEWTLDENLLRCLLERKLHFDNCEIACLFNWRRSPNVFNRHLQLALSFLHL